MTRTAQSSLLAVVLSLTPKLGLAAARPGMVTFISDGQVYVGTEDGSEMLRISSGDSRKAMPKWSPDGGRIVYLDSRAEPHSLGSQVVVDVLGAVLGSYPVATVAPDGTPIEGMPFIRQIGWMDNFHLFAEGHVNPYAAEYRTIDMASHKIGGFIGTGFATCTKAGRVAFWLPVFPPSTAMTLNLSTSEASIFSFPDSNALPTIHVELAWDRGCDTLAFVDQRAPERLVLVVGGRVQKTVPLPRTGVAPIITPTANGFLIGSGGKLLYRPGASRIVPTPIEMINAAPKRDALRQRVAAALGATEMDYQDEQ